MQEPRAVVLVKTLNIKGAKMEITAQNVRKRNKTKGKPKAKTKRKGGKKKLNSFKSCKRVTQETVLCRCIYLSLSLTLCVCVCN